MLKAGVHFGHQSSRWHPKMAPFIYGTRGGVHVIDLDKARQQLQDVLAHVETMTGNGKVILFVGTKRQAREAVKAAAIKAGAPYVTERWIGGLLTNFEEFRRRLKKYLKLKEEVATGEIEKYTKKEQGEFKKQLVKMDKYLSGLTMVDKMPDALYVADMRVEKTAVTEANRMKVAIVGVCDTNVNPDKATYIIPANDDAVNSIKMVAEMMAEAVVAGKAAWAKKQLEMKAASEEKKVAETTQRKEVRPLTVAQSV